MTEPNNPLFDDEKEFLERKKLEYERALRGDVEEIKDQTMQVGKVALLGAGVVGGIWLIAKAFGNRKPRKKKHKKAKHAASFDDYAGFDGYEDDSHDQELHDLTSTYHSPEYAYDHADRYPADSDGFYQGGEPSEQDYLTDEYTAADDNGLSDYPDFPAHSSPQHGADADIDTTYGSHAASSEHLDVYHTDEDHGDDEEPAHSYASANSYQARPYDDSRRLPESDSFDDTDEPTVASKPKKSWLMPAVMAFAQSETGKVVLAQAAAVAMAFVSSKVKDILPSNAADADKNTDLAASSAPKGVSPEAWPATTAAQDASAAAQHDDTNTYRAPLA
ncbi:MAG: hypothetical protein EOO57_20900 [Hymenobacter sp.]|nr:MAG: hypothetical protein EOO57_20900 [Hymenobacter sp.]